MPRKTRSSDHSTWPAYRNNRLGQLGTRVPNGEWRVGVEAWPPSKSNNYLIVSRGSHLGLAVKAPIVTFQAILKRAVLNQIRADGYSILWTKPEFTRLPSGEVRVSKPQPINPLFGADIEVDIGVHLYEPERTRRDVDGIDKVVFDVLTKCGVWRDDVQIGNRFTIRPDHVGERETDYIEIVMKARPTASWLRNKSGRPTRPRATVSAAIPQTPEDATPQKSPRRRSTRPQKDGPNGSDPNPNPDPAGDTDRAPRRATARKRRADRGDQS